MALENITIKGAREHNLKNVNLVLPREQLVVITGLSGSGKSSLAFDTIYAEGQRRYVESLSAYARQFLELMEKPDIDYIEGLSPAISIEQKTSSKNPRSTVGTVTEIYDYLRLLYARVGHVFCYGCGRQIASQTVQQITDQVQSIPEGRKVMILAPIVKDRKGEFKKDLLDLQKKGFVRARVDGEVRSLEEGVQLNKKFKHTIEAVVDRLIIKNKMGKRLADSIETALHLGEGSLVVVILAGKKSEQDEELLFSEKFACSYCGISYPELEPRLFSFNNPTGACFKCDGLGNKMEIDPDLVVPDHSLSIRDGAIHPWQKKTSINFHQMVEALAQNFKFKLSTPLKDLPQKTRDILLYGSGDQPVKYFYEKSGRRQTYTGTYDGIIPDMERRYHETESSSQRDEIARYMRALPCPACNGTRLKKEAVSVRVHKKNIVELTGLSIGALGQFFDELKFSKQEYSIARRIVKEIKERLKFLMDVGLDYLTLNRTSGTLSGGESQRIRLATQIGSSLMGVLYVLDEPSIGLHQRDNDRLLATLTKLRDLGNTVIVVEHDENTITAADYVVDLGWGGHPRRRSDFRRHTQGLAEAQNLAHRAISFGTQTDSRSQKTPPGQRTFSGDQGRATQQSEEHRRQHSAGMPHLHHRRFRFREKHADHRHPVQGTGQPLLELDGQAGGVQEDQRDSPSRQGDRYRPVTHRPHAAVQSRDLHRPVHPDPGYVQRGSGIAPARIPSGPVQLQRERRTVRGLPGRRPDQSGNAFSARHFCDLRSVPRQTLQPRDTGDSYTKARPSPTCWR